MRTRLQVIPLNVKLTRSQLARVIDTALDETAEAIKIDFKVTAQTWEHDPGFKIKSGRGWRLISTMDKPYFYVSGGTRVRHALMSRDFRAKTRPGWIGSRAGRGGVVMISKKIIRPGIKAREFDEKIAKKWEREWPRQITRAIGAVLP